MQLSKLVSTLRIFNLSTSEKAKTQQQSNFNLSKLQDSKILPNEIIINQNMEIYLDYMILFFNRKMNTITKSVFLDKNCSNDTNFSEFSKFQIICLDQQLSINYQHDLTQWQGLVYLLQTSKNDNRGYIILILTFKTFIRDNKNSIQDHPDLIKNTIDLIVFAAKFIVAWESEFVQQTCITQLNNLLIF
ncbi:hypothetical protein SS50377_25487 [Spironucleus salmonicida]|uniref:Uncharacterized protein n=1 Tax=Spironucleus salmonicida TaxID=348837 RepID=A0A9P8RYB5_9EUKA|nr:hypothetical protein SS50377_25487 [Spironucleus salmonicida]